MAVKFMVIPSRSMTLGRICQRQLRQMECLANYENITAQTAPITIRKYGQQKADYGAANFAAPKSWDAWVEYLNADQGFGDKAGNFIGSTDGWRADSLLNNVKSWGVGVDYTFAKNAQFHHAVLRNQR